MSTRKGEGRRGARVGED